MRVALPPGTFIEGYILRHSTGFQVKKLDTPKAEIIAEMRPAGVICPAIERLADEPGACIVVGSTGSTADSALRHRQDALREARILARITAALLRWLLLAVLARVALAALHYIQFCLSLSHISGQVFADEFLD